MLHGWDPIAFLDLEEPDATVARAVLQRAEDMRHERVKTEIQALGVSVGNAVARQLARMFRG